MAEYTQTIGTDNAFELKIIISESQDYENLINNVTVVGYLCKRLYFYDVNPFNTTSTATLRCGDSTYTANPAYDLRGNQGFDYREVIRHTFEVPYDANRTEITFSFDGKLSNFYPHGTLTETVTLTPIVFADDFTIKKGGVETTSLTLGEYVDINITDYDSSRTHKIEFICGMMVDTSSLKEVESFQSRPSINFMTGITSSDSVNATARLYTYNASGSSLIGYKDKSITLIIPDTEEYKPSFNLEWGFRPRGNAKNTAVIEKIKELGAYVQGLSEIYMNISDAEAGAGATLTKATLYMSGYTTLEKSEDSETYTIYPGILTITGNRTLQASVYDSRGRYTTKPDKIIYVAPYSQPSFNGTITRQDTGADTKDNIVITGLDLSSMIQGYISKSDGSEINLSEIKGVSVPSVSVEYMRLGDSTWTSATVEGSNAIINAQKSSPYSIRISIIDYLGVSKEIYLSVASAKIDFHMRNGKARFGSYIDDSRDVTNSFEVDWRSYFNNNVYLKGTLFLKNGTSYISLREYIERIINGG